MQVIYLNNEPVCMEDDIVAAIGFFDGIHKGHQALIDEVKNVAYQKGYKKALITFDHSPSYVLQHMNEEKYLTTINDRKKILESQGIDYLFIIAFHQDVAELSPTEFISRYLIPIHIRHIVCGFDFRFGKNGQGDIHCLKKCHSFTVSVIDEIIDEQQKISSTRIREELKKGHIEKVNDLLGRPYQITGKVIHGREIGRTIGFPTANIDYQSYFLPQRGVYAVTIQIDSDIYYAMCNIGFNPTFTALQKESLEVNILDFNQDIYDKEAIITFFALLRDEKQFASAQDLIKQLKKDQNQVRKLLERERI